MGNGLAPDDALAHIGSRRYLVHHLEQDFLDDGAQAAGASLQRQRAFGGCLQSVTRKDELNLVQGQELGVLLGDGVARLGEDPHEVVLGQRVHRNHNGQTTDKFRNEPVLQQIIGRQLTEQVRMVLLGGSLGSKSKGAFGTNTLTNNVLESLEGTAANKQDVCCVDLDEVLVRMLSSTLRRNIRHGSLDQFQQSLLDALTRNVASNR